MNTWGYKPWALIAVLICAAFAPQVQAQNVGDGPQERPRPQRPGGPQNKQPGDPPGPRGGGRGMSPFFEAMRNSMHELPHREIFEMLRHPPIREALGMSNEKHREIEENFSEGFRKLRDIGDEASKQRWPTEKIEKKILATFQPMEQKVAGEFIEEYGQEKFEKLIGLYAQSVGHAAAANLLVAERIGLEGDDLRAFRQSLSDLRRDQRDDGRRAVRKILENPGLDVRRRIEDVWRRAEKERESCLKGKLSAEQRAALRELQGEPFENLPKPGMRFGFGRGGDGPPPNRPPPGSKADRGREEPKCCN